MDLRQQRPLADHLRPKRRLSENEFADEKKLGIVDDEEKFVLVIFSSLFLFLLFSCLESDAMAFQEFKFRLSL